MGRDITSPEYWDKELENLPGRRKNTLTLAQAEVIRAIGHEMQLGRGRPATEIDRREGHDFEDIAAFILKRLLGSNAEVNLASLRDDLDKYTDVTIYLKQPDVLLSVDFTTNDEAVSKKMWGNFHSGPRTLDYVPAGVKEKQSIPLVLGINYEKARSFMSKFYEAYTGGRLDDFLSDFETKGFYLKILREMRGQLSDYLRSRNFRDVPLVKNALDCLDEIYSQLIKKERAKGTDIAQLLKIFESSMTEALEAPITSHGSLSRA